LSFAIPHFSGFSKDSFNFLLELEKNNNQKWFSKNKERYENSLVIPSKSFITDIGQFFNHLNPAIRTEPKFNQTLMRINKDMRFVKGDPYKNYFLIHFGRFKGDSEFYVYLHKNGIEYGVFLNNSSGEELFFKKSLDEYETEIMTVFRKYNLNGKLNLYEFEKEPELITFRFNAEKNFKELIDTKYILLEKEFKKNEKIIYSSDFLTEVIKIYSNLYPLYCFAISSNPLSLLEEFEDKLGVAK
jgi:uncharacterized protein (TIGR02453 family)